MIVENKRVKHVEELAKNAFKEHTITQEFNQDVFRSFRCGKPVSSNYYFRLSTIPGAIIITGDLGTLVVERVYDMFRWVPDAIGSIDYFAEKVSKEIPVREYDPDVAREWLAELQTAEGTESELAEKASELERYVDEEHLFYREVYYSEVVDGCDFPNLKNWTHRFLWQRECIKWFFKNATPQQLLPVAT